MENTKTKIRSALTRNQIISSIVWAISILACSVTLENSGKEIMYILTAGFFIEFLRITSFNKMIRKGDTRETN